MLERSVFRLTTSKQWVAALGASAWEMNERLAGLARQMFTGVGTQIVEDLIGVQKNARQARGATRFRHPQHGMGVCLASSVVDKRHHYTLVPYTVPVTRKTLRLKQSMFYPVESECSLDLTGVATTSSTASYYSPSVENLGKCVADLAVLRHVRRFRSVDRVKEIDLSMFAIAGSKLVFRRAEPADQAFGWHVALHHYPGSAILARPVEIRSVLGHPNSEFVELKLDVEPSFLVVLSWDGVVARSCQWAAWSWQLRQWPNRAGDLSPVTRLVLGSTEAPLAKVAARQCFWSLDASALLRLGLHLKIALPREGSLCDLLFIMIMFAGRGALSSDGGSCSAVLELRPGQLRSHERLFGDRRGCPGSSARGRRGPEEGAEVLADDGR
mmetsp:Transcript_143783/g.460268  ORF Transcript_143783/g.460268 Transcript_143783/m.460268 type:complete len:384 (+) Transcript_143783:2849-4000(+)